MQPTMPTDEEIVSVLQEALRIEGAWGLQKRIGVPRQTFYLVRDAGWKLKSARVRRRLIAALFPTVQNLQPVEA